MIGVADTSALIRLFVPDGPLPDNFAEFMRGVERGMNRAIAPELLVVEIASVINKKQRSQELTIDESDRLFSDILAVPIRLFPHQPIITRAFEMARKHGLTVYDTLFLSLAEERGAVIFSADHQLIKAADKLRLR